MIAILMATYNGREYVGEQIESILRQTNREWHMYISDDMSTDGTWDVLSVYAERYPEQIDITQRVVNSGSARANFMGMLSLAEDYEYTMFCDQDDIWLPSKVETTLRAMKRMEQRYGKAHAALIHSDLSVADSNGKVVEESMFQLQRLEGTGISFARQLVQNCVTGCTMMMNQSLVKLLHVVPTNYIMHDWWVALVAVTMGHIGFLKTPLIYYRQHGNNAEGAKDFRSMESTVVMAGKKQEIHESLEKTYCQAGEFERIYGEQLDKRQREILNAYISIPNLSKLERMKLIEKYGFWKSGWNRKLGQIIFM